MKLRQKLAMVLASAMIVTAVPVVTMAASTNSYNRTITVMKDQVLDSGTKLALNIDADATLRTETFYVTADGFEFNVDANGNYVDPLTVGTKDTLPTGVTVKGSKSSLKVTVTSNYATGTGEDSTEFAFPVWGKVTGETPTIAVDGEGSIVSSNKYPIMGESVASKGLTVTAGDKTNISTDGEGFIGNITIEEAVQGQLNGQWIEVELDNSDLAFDGSFKVEGQRGLMNVPASGVTFHRVDDQTALFHFDTTGQDGRGSIILKEIGVEAENPKEDVDTGAVEVSVRAVTITDKNGSVDAEDWDYSSNNDIMDRLVADVAEVQEFAVSFTVADEKEFTAGGETQTVKVKLKELTTGALNDRYNVYFNIEGAKLVDIVGATGEGKDAELTLGTAPHTVKLSVEDKTNMDELILEVDNMDDNVANEFEFELELKVTPENTDDVVITASSKGMEEDIELTVGTAELDRTFEVEVAELEVGVRGQVAGEIVITEEDAEVFTKGDTVRLEVEGADDDYNFIEIVDFDIETTGDLEAKINEDVTIGTGSDAFDTDVIEITKDSDDEAASLTIKNIKFNTNNATPNGTYKVKLIGDLVSEEGDSLEKEFIVVGEGNEPQAEVVLQVGNAEYTVDGEAATAEIAPFIDATTNRTMAPVRAVAEAFGCELDFFFPVDSDQLVITMTKGDKTVQFQNGSNIMVVNGGQFIMSATAQIKDGHTFVPVAFLAQALNIDYTWDGATQTIVFGN